MDKPIHIGDEPAHLEAHVSAPQFTCLSCLIGFPDGDAQRGHYRSDHHRYNMKRRVAGLPPISTLAFNQKVLDKRAETALTTADRGATCEVCNKVYSTENAYRSHIISKKHRENELKIALQPTTSAPVSGEVPSAPEAYGGGASTIAESSTTPKPAPTSASKEDEDDSDEDMEEEDEDEQTLDEKLAAARSRIGPLSCLFCTVSSPVVADNVEHMAKAHSFFIPDAAYVEDLPGLITYLAEKLAIGNACLHCNREFRDLHAVRKHMFDKSHLKIAYDTERQRLEISDFYDFTSSYPEADAAGNARRSRTARKTITAAAANADEEWESDEDDDENVTVGEDESVYDVESSEDEDDDDELVANNLEYGDTPYELVLPSGAKIGHRSMSRYYKQSFSAPLPQKHAVKEGAAPSGRELVQQILADQKKDGVLVPAHGGGFGAFGKGTQVIKARNRGEAREAGRHVREFRDQNRREQFKTKVGFIANSQKHFRDPLLQ